jgi:hypothetical protein
MEKFALGNVRPVGFGLCSTAEVKPLDPGSGHTSVAGEGSRRARSTPKQEVGASPAPTSFGPLIC